MKIDGDKGLIPVLSKAAKQVTPHKTVSQNKQNLAPRLLSVLAGVRIFKADDDKVVVLRVPVDKEQAKDAISALRDKHIRGALR